ncbi:MAG: hypothetical protein AAFR93_03495 [Pseudomonadota bacterium]
MRLRAANPLPWVARQGRWGLVAGLVAGLALPGLAETLRPWLPHMVAGLLFFTGLRIGLRQALGVRQDLGEASACVLILQLGLPLLALGLVHALDLAATPLGLVLVLAVSAPSISGAPNFAALMGHDPAPALRLLILGTAIFPLTVLPIFWLLPALGSASAALFATSWLFLVIFGSIGLGFAARAAHGPLSEGQRTSLDGLTVILLAVIVVALMSALGPALTARPVELIGWMALAFTLNFGAQILARYVSRHRPNSTALGLVAGNRNLALFLVALPTELTDPLMIFIGCAQLPMYLTPLVLERLYRPAPVTQ